MSTNISIGNAERNFDFEAGSFWSGSNGSWFSTYSGGLGWSFAADGRLILILGDRVVTP